MKFDPTELPSEDLKLYFSGSFIKLLPRYKKWEMPEGWVYCSDVFHDDDVMFQIFTSSHHDKSIKAKHCIIDICPPSTGHFNYKESSVFFSRLNKRQNKKGIALGNTATMSSFIDDLRGNIEFPIRGGIKHFHAEKEEIFVVLNGKRFSDKEQAFKDILAGKFVSRAISPQILMSVGFKDKWPSAFFGKSYLGKWISPHEIAIETKPLLEDAKELCRPLGISLV
jgi:hypothetical protein